ncbi:MAG: citrate/2-methylcitrate synthase [Prevotella sp.]|jgi:citrate synthase|nr:MULTISPECIES: citrate/2-methylcitrate synthase [unclassified Prevotella]MCH3969119.1 citrate/2-methylcitrate synthase [Prevotella sp.]MCH3985202.1 citrate/2-methylcitrate synthase [Prevotella sp.]MCH3992031.1 citrate/2-methylcitrate synthase [Prevotella sp.]MCH4017395.1 citrate/2-methylcitrate synthase [Prevotella sp.]MCH4099635.1 citrate/2-methylcitrate synthase [Prevotella sp.]
MKKEYLIYKLSDEVKSSCKIPKEAFQKYGVKRGLRNEDGTGVLVGLTNIGNVVGYNRDPDGKLCPCDGKLYYRGYELDDLVSPLLKEKRFGFEEIAYLILSGELPDREELEAFKELLNDNMPLDHRTIVHIIDLEGSNIMNILARCVLEMYTFDPNPDDISRDNLMRQSIELIAKFPTIVAYAYNIYCHSVQGQSLNIRHPKENLCIAENFLYMLGGEDYTNLDARILDLLLILQAEHGGGNNSTFTVRVTSSTRTDTYSSIAAGIGSLKGPLHGGANIKVINMLHHLKESIKDWTNVDEIDTYLNRMLNKEAYDKSGLIYGIGHAVYTKSDPRAVELKKLGGELAKEKGREEEYHFLTLLEQEGIKCLMKHRGGTKPACANLDFYSGFIYEMLGLPQEIYTPIFAMARIVGWTAHRIEELNFEGRRIIRPAYNNLLKQKKYVRIDER